MKEIKRDEYLNKLISSKHNGLIKIVTGLRRVGKSYLLDPIFKNYLISTGVNDDHIIKIDLDYIENHKYHDPNVLFNYIMEKRKDNNMYYILLDEIQEVTDFESVLNSLLGKGNFDVYVTGSNSKFLSKDVKTEFRGRGDEIKVYPLSFSEYYSAVQGDKRDAFRNYIMYGGMPYSLAFDTHEKKSTYLKSLFTNTYIKDIVDRYNIQKTEVLDKLLDILATSIGSLTNPTNIANVFNSNGYPSVDNNGNENVNNKIISSYLDYLIDAFLIEKADRYDIKGKKIITTPSKYYYTDIGLRNARLNFREQDEDHLMENIIYNELLIRGFNVDVGVVEHFENDKDGKTIRKQLEIDFIANLGRKKYYIQSAFSIPNNEKMIQETKSLDNVNDNFKKIIIVRDDINIWQNEDGIVIMNVIDFLLDKNSLDA